MDSNNLTVLAGGKDEDLSDVEYSEEGLRLFIAEALKGKGELAAGFTVDDVMNSALFANLRTTCEEGYKKSLEEINAELAGKRRKLEVERTRLMVEKAAQLEAVLREEHNLPPVLTQAEIDAQLQESLERKTVAGENDGGEEYDIRSRVRILQELFGDMLPSRIYTNADYAILFRVVLIGFVRPFTQKLKEAGLDAEYRANIAVMQKEVSNLLDMTTQVIFAWGDDTQTRVVDPRLFRDISDLARTDERYAWLSYCPTPEELTLRAEAKAKVVAKDEQEQVARGLSREEIATKLVAGGYDADVAGKIAKRIVKNHFGEGLGFAGKMIKMEAVKKMVEAQSEEDQSAARKLAQVVDMSADELERSVDEFRKEHDRSKYIRECVHGVTVTEKRYADRSDPNFGAEKPETSAKRKKDKNGGGNQPKGGKNKAGQRKGNR